MANVKILIRNVISELTPQQKLDFLSEIQQDCEKLKQCIVSRYNGQFCEVIIDEEEEKVEEPVDKQEERVENEEESI